MGGLFDLGTHRHGLAWRENAQGKNFESDFVNKAKEGLGYL